MKGLFFLQGLEIEKYNLEVLTRFKSNFLPKLIGYIQATEEPEKDIVESATEIFGNE